MSGRNDEEQRWQSRPWLAGLLRAAIVLVPVLLAAAVTMLGTRLIPRSSGATWLLVHVLVFAASIVTALVAERAARRLLPVAMLLKLTLLFPDRAPSRFKVARKANAVRLLEESAARTDDAGAASTATAVLTLLAALTSHDKRTRGHAERVRVYAELLGEQLNLPPRDRDLLRWGALLHDIGKLEVAATVLNKPGKPNEREWEILRSHPQRGARLAAALMPWLGEWGGSILEHHERYDGTGYPNGLSGHGISRAGRLIAVVDAYEVMTAARSYKRATSTLKARQELADCAGSHFDPLMVKAFLAVSLPRLLWATGPLSFLVQLPFVGVLREAGTRAAASVGSQTVGVAGAAVLATAGTVTGSVLGPQAAVAESPPASAPAVVRTAPTPAPSARPAAPEPAALPALGHTSGEPRSVGPSSPASTGSVANAVRRIEVTARPPASSSSPEAEIAFTVHGGGGAVCSIDSGAFATCASPLPLKQLSAGTHRVEIRPADGGSAEVVTWQVVAPAPPAQPPAQPETQPQTSPPASQPQTSQPEAPQAPTATPTPTPTPTPQPTPDTTAPRITVTSAPPALSASSDAEVRFVVDDAGADITCSLDGGAAERCFNSWARAGLADGTHTLRIRAADAAGNVSLATRTWTVDTSRPALRIISGPNAATSARTATVQFAAEAGATVTCSLDGAAPTVCSNPWTTARLADGPHVLELTATDRAGNVTVVRRSWTVDRVAPTLTVTSGPPSLTKDSAATFTYVVDDPTAEVTCSLDGAAPNPCTSPWRLSSLANGTHTVTFSATDAAGNTTTETRSWTVDTVAPALTIDTGPPASTSSPSATVTYTAEPGATVRCTVDGAAATPCGSPLTITGLADGIHTVTLIAADGAGNETTASRTWTVDTVAPALSITSGPATRTSSRSASVAYTAESGAVVTCSLDGAAPRTCGSPWATSGLTDGTHTLVLTATDAANNVTTVQHTWTVDTVAPSLRVTSAPSGTSGRDVTVDFTVDDPTASVTCALNGQPAADCSGGSWTGTHLGGGTQTLVLTARDDLGNNSGTTLTWTVDTSAPNLVITAGPPAATAATAASISYTVDDATATIACTLDGVALSSCTSPVGVTGLADGSHTFRITATDTNGNVSSATRTWTVDTAGPTMTVTSAPPALSNRTSAKVTYTLDDSSAKVTCVLDGGQTRTCNGSWTRSGLAAGTHSLVLTAVDAAGNSSSRTVTWTIDTTAPVLTLLSGPPSLSTSGSASMTYTVDDAGATVTCSIDGSSAQPCSSPWTVTGLADGSHTMTVTAVDAAGNSSSISRSWTIDRSTPRVAIASGPDELLTTTYFTLSGPAGTSFECSWDQGGWEACDANPSRAVGFGQHTFSARGHGANGLPGTAVTTTWFAVL